ncbi:MAG TPA: FAD-dependent oxidoreductase, partial [Aquificaceae bacterium]|nr:FAD-dependent oxidoreductase [Aquificaceae bacterium]
MSKHIVVVGGGIGGLATAYNLRRLAKDMRITLISNRPYFGFTPAFPHLALGWRSFEDITVPLAPLLPKFGIEFINEAAESLDPEVCKVKLKSGKEISYDFLVIATGPKLVFGVKGQEILIIHSSSFRDVPSVRDVQRSVHLDR